MSDHDNTPSQRTTPMSQNEDTMSETRSTPHRPYPDDGETPSANRSRARVSMPNQEPDPEPEPTGYRKPPPQHRFKPGKSGNPKGRPLGSKNKPKPMAIDGQFADIVLQEVYREVSVPVGGEMVTLPMAQLGMRAVMARAAKGNVGAMRLATELTGRIEAQREQQQLTTFQDLVTYKADAQEELARRKRLGLKNLPPVLPHPDDIHIDVRRVTAEIKGPVTLEEKEKWDQHTAWLALMADRIAGLRAYLEVEDDPTRRRRLKRTIKDVEAKMEEARAQMPNWVSRPDEEPEGASEPRPPGTGRSGQ